MSVAHEVVPAVLDYLSNGAYPDSETVASAALSPDVLAQTLTALNQAQDEIKAEIRSQSKNVAPDVDSWIAKAKELQADILRSRETARQIVAEAAAGEKLSATVKDVGDRVALLEKEVTFNETLFGTLEHVKYANELLDRALHEIVRGDIGKSVERLESADASIAALQNIENCAIYDILRQRAIRSRDDLVSTVKSQWNALICFDPAARSLTILDKMPTADSDTDGHGVTLSVVIKAAQELGVLDEVVKKLGKDFERIVLGPRLLFNQHGQAAKLAVETGTLRCAGWDENASISSLLDDLRIAFDFLDSRLPSTVTQLCSEAVVPDLLAKMEQSWLEPAVPLDITGMAEFQSLLVVLSDFAEYIASKGWWGAKEFQAWSQNAPRTWLTKRREAVLGETRNLVFNGSRDTHVVERVETQLVSKQEALAATGGVGEGDDEWGAAWDDSEEAAAVQQSNLNGKPAAADEEDMSAWDMDDDNDEKEKEDMADTKPGNDDSAWDVDEDEAKATEATGDEEAWGWDEDESKLKAAASGTSGNQSVPQVTDKHEKKSREITLRETFTVTAIPDGIVTIIKQLIADAEALAGPEFASSSIAPAGTALYSLPTLALAIYRATAPTAYSKLGTGNMLIYNDSSRLIDQLRAWQADRPPSSRLRLNNDVKALEAFAKRAYASEMELQRTILQDLIDGAQGFSNCTTSPYKAECESAVEQTVHRLREVRRQWEDVLSSSALLQSLGSLLATVTSKIILDIEDLADISAADSHQLKLLIEQVTNVKDLFNQPHPGNPGNTPQMDMTFVYCPNWAKFQYLAEILDSNLADIKYMWSEGELSLEFASHEVVGLIEALFAESELRRQAIRDVSRPR